MGHGPAIRERSDYVPTRLARTRFAGRARNDSPAGLGCSVGPKYVRPPVQSPPAYKELPQAGANGSDAFRTAQPSDGTTRGKWWEVFNDPQLNELEEKASSSNQEIAAAADNFLAARALVREARSQYFPTVTANPSIINSRPNPGQFGGLQAGSSSGPE